MKTSDFEQRLSAQPFRPIPPDWRSSILASAHRQAASVATPTRTTLATLWHAALRPWRIAWTSVAACWVAILVLDAAARPGSADADGGRANAQAAASYFSLFQQPWQLESFGEPGPRLPSEVRPQPMPSQGNLPANSVSQLA